MNLDNLRKSSGLLRWGWIWGFMLLAAVPPQARVQERWQGAFLNFLEQKQGKDIEGWALFTYGGWSDSGQVMVIKENGQQVYYRIPPNYPGVKPPPHQATYVPKLAKNQKSWVLEASGWQSFSKPLTTEQWKALEQAAASFEKLEDLPSRVFDGLEVEYIRAVKKGSRVEVVKRVYMHSPDEKRGKKHSEALDQFMAVIDKVGK